MVTASYNFQVTPATAKFSTTTYRLLIYFKHVNFTTRYVIREATRGELC